MKIKVRKNVKGETVHYASCDTLEAEVRKIFARCGMQGCSSHTGRRSRATELNKQNIDLSTISKMLGHADQQVTLRYIEISERQKIKGYELGL